MSNSFSRISELTKTDKLSHPVIAIQSHDNYGRLGDSYIEILRLDEIYTVMRDWLNKKDVSSLSVFWIDVQWVEDRLQTNTMKVIKVHTDNGGKRWYLFEKEYKQIAYFVTKMNIDSEYNRIKNIVDPHYLTKK